jgi:ATP-dependent Clp protease protease subunit
MTDLLFEIPKDATRIWELGVPIVVDKENKVITAYLTDTIDEPHVYNELCYLLSIASADTVVNIIINTPGGIIDSAFMLTDAIMRSEATVVGHLSGTVASAGTMISMVCDTLVVAPHLSFMIHNYSGGIAGKGHEMKARQKFTDDHLNAAFKSFYSGFLEEAEMNSVIEGTDLWMSTDEVIERWSHRVDYLESDTDE